MGLLDALPVIARALRAGVEVYDAYKGSQAAQERLWRHGLPALLDGSLPGAGAIANVGIEVLDRRAKLLPPPAPVEDDVVDAEFRSTDTCTLCGPEYSPTGEQRVWAKLRAMKGGVIAILGLRETGKTSLTFTLAELWPRRPAFAIGIPQAVLPDGWTEIREQDLVGHVRVPVDENGELLDETPAEAEPTSPTGPLDGDRPIVAGDELDQALRELLSHRTGQRRDGRPRKQRYRKVKLDPVEQIEQLVPQHSILVVDDAGLALDSSNYRAPMNLVIKRLVMICRHLDIQLIVNMQYSGSVIHHVMDANAHFYKPAPEEWQTSERDSVKARHERLLPFWTNLSDRATKSHAYVFCSRVYEGPFHYDLPEAWTADLSRNKAFSTTGDS